MKNNTEIAQFLREQRKEQNLKTADCAAKAGMSSHSYLIKLEKGEKDFTINTCIQWAEALGYEIMLVKTGSVPQETEPVEDKVSFNFKGVKPAK